MESMFFVNLFQCKISFMLRDCNTFMKPWRKKSQLVRSGELGGQSLPLTDLEVVIMVQVVAKIVQVVDKIVQVVDKTVQVVDKVV